MNSNVTGCWGEIQTKQHAPGLQYTPMQNGYTENYPKPYCRKKRQNRSNTGALICLSLVSMIVGLVLGIISGI